MIASVALLDSAVVTNPRVTAQPMPRGCVLLDEASSNCFELNRVGAEIWGQIAKSVPLRQVVEGLARKYGVPEADLARDLLSLVEDLVRHGIVTVERR